MVNKKWYAVALIFIPSLGIGSCATQFVYKFYGMQGVRYEQGKLIGPSSDDDIDFVRCKPIPGIPRPCTVLFTDEFLRLRSDFIFYKTGYETCQKELSVYR